MIIPLANLVVEGGRFKKIRTVIEEGPGGSYTRDGIHPGVRRITEELTDEEKHKLSKALRVISLVYPEEE